MTMAEASGDNRLALGRLSSSGSSNAHYLSGERPNSQVPSTGALQASSHCLRVADSVPERAYDGDKTHT
jgi:hypothetical protein